MNEHEKAAYVILRDTAEKLWSLVTNARSSSHPLVLAGSTVDAIKNAVLALHAAQREMEHPRPPPTPNPDKDDDKFLDSSFGWRAKN